MKYGLYTSRAEARANAAQRSTKLQGAQVM